MIYKYIKLLSYHNTLLDTIQKLLLFIHPVVSDSVTMWTATLQASLSLTISWIFPTLMSVASVMPSNHLILRCLLFLLSSIFPSIRDFSNASAVQRWPKYWSFSFSISSPNEYSGLISLMTDWLDILAVQGALRRLLQNHSLKSSSLWCSDFFMVQLSSPCVTTGKTISLTTWAFVGWVMPLLFNTLSRFAIAFLPRSTVVWFHDCSHHLQWF